MALEDDEGFARATAQLNGMLGLLTQHQLAELLNVQTTTLREWRRLGKGPDFVKIEKAVYYRLEDVQKWIKLNVVPTNRATFDTHTG